MLKYSEIGLSHREVPGEISVCIYITGCPNRCIDCHYPELQSDQGIPLNKYYEGILNLYGRYATCVCFLGEGNGSQKDREELLQYLHTAKQYGFKCCLYSGRDTEIEEWMRLFDYVKTGSYQKTNGPLSNSDTNQRMYRITGHEITDITSAFRTI